MPFPLQNKILHLIYSIIKFGVLQEGRAKEIIIFEKALDKKLKIEYNIQVAGVAQSVVQLIRNQQVVCSSHITSSKKALVFYRSFFLVKKTLDLFKYM